MPERKNKNLAIQIILLLSIHRIVTLGVIDVGVLAGQDGSESRDDRSKPKFDIVSIRPVSPSARKPIDLRVQPGGRVTITNLSLDVIIKEAFAIKGYQIAGSPSWLSSNRFDITAKAEGDPPRKILMEMLQSILTDRFQFRYHWKTKREDVYALLLGKDKPKVQPSTAAQSFVRLIRNTPPDEPGVSFTIQARGASMAMFADRLGEIELGRPVLDLTGLKGKFDFTLAYSVGDDPDAGPQIFTAIHEQLGLKIKAQKGNIPILVIDHIEKPSAN